MEFDPESLRAIIFDLDGLLIDSEPTWFKVEGAFLARHGFEWTRQQADACMGRGTPHTLQVWHDLHGISIDIERDTETIVSHVIAHAPEMPLKEGALPLLELARSMAIPMAVASSSRRRLIRAVLGAKGIESFFAAVVSGQDVAHGKPEPDVFLRAAELLGIPIAHCLVLEDAIAGVRAARAAGAPVIAIPSVNDAQFAQLATRVVTSLHDVAALLRGMRCVR